MGTVLRWEMCKLGRSGSSPSYEPFPVSKESSYVLKAGLIQGNTLAIDNCTTSVMAFGVFSAYLMIGGAFTPKTVFTPLSLFNFLQRNVVRFFVRSVFQVMEARVAVVRIQVGIMMIKFYLCTSLLRNCLNWRRCLRVVGAILTMSTTTV